MIDIKTISGEQLMTVPILQDAVIHEELMASDYIMLSWNSDKGDTLPIGTYIEHEGERYSLIEPYTPTMVSEIEYKYTPQFHSREALWNKQPACVYTYEEDGTTVKTREFDWSFVGSPADAMQIVRQAIRNETGEEWSVVISDSLPASIELSAQAASIQSVLASIADLCETEYWTTKADNTIHLSKCEHGEVVALEVGVNVNVPTVMAGNAEYYTRYYALGSTRNITQSAGSINGSVNKRLTLDPAVYPYGYKDVKGHFENGVFVSDLEQGEVFSKVVVFDNIYPSSELQITDARPRMKYRLEGGEKIKVGGTDENPVYDQYAIWYFKIKDFTFSDDLLIAGLPLSVHFKSGRLTGQEFELIYHDKAKTENAEGDVVPFNVDAGDYEIKFKESDNGTILPDYAYIIPQNDDKITLFNIEMPSEYTASARTSLLEALEKEIESDHKDGNSYEFESNPVAFYESETDVVLGQKVSFVNGDKVLDTRVLMVERHLDYPCEQKIRVGNNIIKGSSKELRDDVASLNQNVDVLAAFNDLSKSIQDSYGRNQALVNEAIALINNVWKLEGDNLVTEKQVVIRNNSIVYGDIASGGTGQTDNVSVSGILVNGVRYIDTDYDGYIDLSDAFEGLQFDIDLSEYYTKAEVDTKIASIDLSDYYTKADVDRKIEEIDLSPYATKTDLQAMQEEVDALENLLGSDVSGYIDTWEEVVSFLDGYKDSEDLAAILATMEGKIGDNTNAIATLGSTVSTNTANIASLGGMVSKNTEDIAKNASDIAKNAEDIASLDSKMSPVKAWHDNLSPFIVYEGGVVKIKASVVAEGDISSGGQGSGEVVVTTTLAELEDVSVESITNGDILIYNRSTGKWENKPQTAIVPDLTGYATEAWVYSQGYLKPVDLEDYAKTSEVLEEVQKVSEALDDMWKVDEEDNLTTEKKVVVGNDMFVQGDISSAGIGTQDTKNKGYFRTAEDLALNYPIAYAGCIAYVGLTYPYAIYVWDVDTETWVDSGQTGGQENVPLGDYYTKAETHEAIRSEYVVLTQEEYDALAVKEDKLYFIYEEE